MLAVSVVVLSPLCFVVPPPVASRAPALARFAAVGPRVAAASISMEAVTEEDVDESKGFDAWESQIEADADAVFAVIDVDGDGSISRGELLRHLCKAGYAEDSVNVLFDKLDTDADKTISKEELRAGFIKYTPLRSAPGMGAYNAEFVTEIHADADSLFTAIDLDNSGTITRNELRDHLKRVTSYSFKAIANLFSLLDVDGDDSVTKEELRAAFVRYSALRQAIGEGPNFK